MKDDQALRWMRDAARVVSAGRGLSADELLSDMVVSLKGELGKIKNYGNAVQLARWRFADWKRAFRGPEPVDPEQAQHVEPVEPEVPAELPDLGDLAVWRRRFERELTRRAGRPVRLGDRRVKELLRARAKALTEEDPEIGLALLGIASEPSTLYSRRGPVARRV